MYTYAEYLAPGTWYLVLGTWYQVRGNWYLVQLYLVPGARSQVPGTRYLHFDVVFYRFLSYFIWVFEFNLDIYFCLENDAQSETVADICYH